MCPDCGRRLKDAIFRGELKSCPECSRRHGRHAYLRPERLKTHLAFGTGPHFCLGAPLVRAEAATSLNALLDRYVAIEREGAGVRFQSRLGALRGFKSLPLYARR